ncbi:hypothetical protein OG21DRAFT_1527765 [Imleria badia]|nr:hypothetical protein OG21DRAFT_1527765 [Imleria badia]
MNAKDRLDAAARTALDDKDELRDEKTAWFTEWKGALNDIRAVMPDVCKCRLDTRPGDELTGRVKKANKAYTQSTVEQEAHEKDATEKWEPDSTEDKGPDAKEAKSETAQTVSEAGQKWKRIVCRVTDESNNDIEIIEKVDVDHVKTMAKASAKPEARAPARPIGHVRHVDPCSLCAKAVVICEGQPDRACDQSMGLRIKCKKTMQGGGKGGRSKAVGSKGKERPRAQARPMMRVVILPHATRLTPDSSPSLEEEEDEVPRKRAKVARPSGPSTAAVVDVKRTVTAMEAKLLTARGYIKDLEVHASAMGAYIASQQADLEWVKAVLDAL